MKTKDKIILTMYKLIAEKGYDKSSIGQICDELGIKKPSVYYYFKSKEEILVTIADNMMKEASNSVIEEVNSKESYKEFLLNLGYEAIDSFIQDPERLSVIMELYTQSKRIESIRNMIKFYDDEFKNHILNILYKGVELGAFDEMFDVNKNMTIIVNTLQGIEFSIVFGLNQDHRLIWDDLINKIFCE